MLAVSAYPARASATLKRRGWQPLVAAEAAAVSIAGGGVGAPPGSILPAVRELTDVSDTWRHPVALPSPSPRSEPQNCSRLPDAVSPGYTV
jgi:hypothetical protein